MLPLRYTQCAVAGKITYQQSRDVFYVERFLSKWQCYGVARGQIANEQQRSTVERLIKKVQSFQVSEWTCVCQQRLLLSKAESVNSPFFANLSAIDRSGPFLQSNRHTRNNTVITIKTVLHIIHTLLQQRHLACGCLLYAPLGAYPVEKPPALRHYDIKFINVSEMYIKKQTSVCTAYFCGDLVYIFVLKF